MASFWLEFDQDGRRQQYNFDAQQVTVGREQGSDLFLDHPTVSRQHAIIRTDARGVRLVVLSKSGLTAVNGTPVQGEVELTDGTQLHFGQLGFVFRSNQARPVTGSFGQAPGGFGGQTQGFGSPSPSGGLGTPPRNGFGGQPQGFGGSPAQQSGFGAQPSFGGQPSQQGGFGAQSVQGGGFGSSQPGFGGASAPQGFGSQPQQQTPAFGQPAQHVSSRGGIGFGGTPSGGFGNSLGSSFGSPGPTPSAGAGGFGQTGGFGAQAAATTPPKTNDENGIMSWDEIARTADDDKGNGGGGNNVSDFQRLEAAAKKANAQSKSNPLILVALVAIVGMVAFIMWPADESSTGDVAETTIAEAPPIVRGPGEVDCVGAAECKAKAEQSFRVGSELLDKVEVDVQNRFEGYNRLLLAQEFLKKAGIETIPPEFANLETRRDKARHELDVIFRDLRVRYHSARQRKMYVDMADALNQIQALFPHKGAREHIWAVQQERELKDAGNYPQTLR